MKLIPLPICLLIILEKYLLCRINGEAEQVNHFNIKAEQNIYYNNHQLCSKDDASWHLKYHPCSSPLPLYDSSRNQPTNYPSTMSDITTFPVIHTSLIFPSEPPPPPPTFIYKDRHAYILFFH